MEKAVVYARYSTNKQKEMSIDGQIRVCQEYADKHGITIIGYYKDKALTGKVDKRPEFLRMIKDSHKRLFKYVLVYQFDRFARNIYDNLGHERRLNDNGVKVLSAMEHVDDSASGRFMRNILLAQNQYFSEELSTKVKRGMYDSFLRGYSSGSNVYGYGKIKVDPNNENSKTKRFLINKKEAEIVQGIFADYVSGKKITEIKVRLDKDHIYNRQGKPFHKNTISQMIQNKMYVGTLKFAEHERENAVPQIIDKGVFMAAQKRINKNKRKPSIHKAVQFYLLSLKTFCGLCKSTMIGDSGTGRTGTIYRYYTCTSKKKRTAPCDKKQVNKKWLEDLVVNTTMTKVLTDKAIRKSAEMLVAYNDQVLANSKIDHLESELKAICIELENLVNAIAQGLAIGTIKDKALALESQKVELQNEIESEKLNAPIRLTLDQYIFWFEQFKDGDTSCEKFRERLIDAFINKVILFDDKIIIVYNIKDGDNEKISVTEIIKDFEDSSVFGYEQLGDPYGTRTRDTAVKGRCLNRLTKGPQVLTPIP